METDEPEDEDEFAHTHSLSEGRDTSRAASHKAYGNAAEVKAAVYRLLLEGGPTTDEKLIAALPQYPESTVRPRRGDLVREGWVRPLTDPDTRAVVKQPNVRGNACIVWEALAAEPGESATVPRRKPTKPPTEHELRALLTDAIVTSMQDRDGCGSDLEAVGDELEDDTWLWVSGALDIHHLVSDVLATLDKELTRA